MKQVVQPLNGKAVDVVDVPRPSIGPTEVLVRTVASVISPGTEGSVTSLAQSSVVSKARARPDLVRQVIRKARTEGLAATTRSVRSRLGEDLPLGYSAAGVAVEVGTAVRGIRPGQLVATAGAGRANHAEYQAVPGLLCAPVPEGVPAQDAAFATIASIALHGLRLATVEPGSKVVVIGLGLVGQLAARLAMAAGCDVVGIDISDAAVATAQGSGVLALHEQGDATTERVLAWSRGRGADAVLLCAAGRSSAVVRRAPALCRDRATVVVVGDLGLDLERTPFYEREISLRFARSYGPGRYEQTYEEWGVDYPAGQVRWTEGRNLEAVLDLLATGRLRVDDLLTHTFPIGGATGAYEMIEHRTEPYMAIGIRYPDQPSPEVLAAPTPIKPSGTAGADQQIGWIGAGAFTTGTLIPAFRAAGFDHYVAVASARGVSALRAAERHGFEKAVSASELLDDPAIDIVVVATPHETHAGLVVRALEAGKHVWCEKPLALTEDELDAVEGAWRSSGRHLVVGLNRRWSPAVEAANAALADVPGPRTVVYRVAAGPVPEKHWYRDRRQGGRLLGEVCHFVDTVQALVGSDVDHVVAVAGGRPAELSTSDDVAVTMRFVDGSLGMIAYSSAATSDKEHIEVLTGTRRCVISNFRSVEVDDKTVWRGGQDKGHRALAAEFHRLVSTEETAVTEQMLATQRWTLRAADGLGVS